MYIFCFNQFFLFSFLLYLRSTLISSLSKNETATHECAAIFFTPGRFKVDIQCKTQSSSTVSNDTHHHWKFIPPIEVLVVN